MKKIFAAVLSALSALIVMAVQAQTEFVTLDIDSMTTADVTWEPGDKIEEGIECSTNTDFLCYTTFLGVSAQGNILVQQFYASGKKHSDPHYVIDISVMDDVAMPYAGMSHFIAVGPVVLYHENGVKLMEGNFHNGKPEGLLTVWHDNGQKQFEETYQNGVPVGTSRTWFKNGQLEFEGRYQGDVVEVRIWDEKGTLLEENIFSTPEE